jgi:5,5'-dehydrodivanillate O-demethylase oxygenase subunit
MATTREENERLTQVGPGTPMGNLMRSYWQVVGVTAEFDKEPVQSIRVLGEDLTLYRSESGEFGLIGPVCPHRCASMEYGIPDPRGLRCMYHGWLFAADGRCLEAPYEDRTHPEAHMRDKVRITAYPAQALGGLVFAYLGKLPAPLLPRWDLLVRDDLEKFVEVHPLPCNWVQCMDNTADPIHFEFLHAGFGNYQRKRWGRTQGMNPAHHVKIEFKPFRYGIMKHRLLDDMSEDNTEWTIGHPLIFPNILAVGDEGNASLHFRVPVDDTHTLHFTYWTKTPKDGGKPGMTGVKHVELFDEKRKFIGDPDGVITQDMIAWVAQGPISDRVNEHLASSDKGVIMFHKMLVEAAGAVARGEDPLGTIRDEAENQPSVDINRGRDGWKSFQVGGGTVFGRQEAPVPAEKETATVR